MVKTLLRYTILILVFLSVISLFLAGCSNKADSDANILRPEYAVKLYYESLDNKDYEIMYSLISDGFKKIDPLAKDYSTFEEYMSKFFDTATGVEVISVKETSNNGKKSTVDYTINILNSREKNEFKSTFTLKKQADGWKLIHPYGDNIDMS